MQNPLIAEEVLAETPRLEHPTSAVGKAYHATGLPVNATYLARSGLAKVGLELVDKQTTIGRPKQVNIDAREPTVVRDLLCEI